MTQTIAAQLEANAVADANGIWITSPDTGANVSWSEAAARSRHIACQLDALGVEAGDSVAVASPNGEDKRTDATMTANHCTGAA